MAYVQRPHLPAEPDVATPAGGRCIAVVGTPSDGQVPTYVAANGRFEPTTPAGASGIPASTVDAKGDLLVATANDAVTRLAVGTDGHVLTADAAQATGVKWAAAGAAAAPDPFEYTDRQWVHQINGAGAAYETLFPPATWSASGSTATDNDNDASWIRASTTAISGNATAVQAITGARIQRAYLPVYVCRMKTYTSLANVRFWFGLTNGNPTATADLAGGHLAMFRYDTGAGDTQWMCCTKDGTTQSTTASGITPATDTMYLFRIECGASSVLFYINGSLVATHTTNLPGTNDNMGVNASLTTLSANIRSYKYSRQWGRLRG